MDEDETAATTDVPHHETEDNAAMSAADKAVYEAAVRIEARGEKLTVVGLRAEAGGGSMSKITRVRRAYLADKAKRAMAPLDNVVSLGLRQALIAETERVATAARQTYEAQLATSEEHAKETAEIIANLERDLANLQDQLAAVEVENDQLRRQMEHKDVAHAAKDAEREAQLTKAVTMAAAADNARRDVEKKLVLAERDKAQAEALSQIRADERRAMGEALDKERARREEAEKALAVAEAQARAQAEVVARIERELGMARTEAMQQRTAAEKLRDEVKAGHATHRELEAARGRADEAKALSEAKADTLVKEQRAALQALEAEREKRTVADKKAAIAEARATERAESATRIERELRAEVAQLRTAVEEMRAKPHAGAAGVPAQGAAADNNSSQPSSRKPKERK